MRKLLPLLAVAGGVLTLSMRSEVRGENVSPACTVPKSWGAFKGVVADGGTGAAVFEATDGTVRLASFASFDPGTKAADKCVGHALEPKVEIRRSE